MTKRPTPEVELATLWSGEGDDIRILLGGWVYLWLSADSTNRYDIQRPFGVDEVTLTWTFHGPTLDEVVRDALEFARALVALEPKED